MRTATPAQRDKIRANRAERKAALATRSEQAQAKDADRVKANRAAVEEKMSTVKQSLTVAPDLPRIIIGVDPGTKTGVGVYEAGRLTRVVTTTIVEAIELVAGYAKGGNLTVYIEDARMATYGRRGKQSAAQAQGAGSIKRDCSIWETEMKRRGIPYRMVRPNKQSNAVAENKPLWMKLTGWEGRCSVHARDAVMIARRWVKTIAK